MLKLVIDSLTEGFESTAVLKPDADQLGLDDSFQNLAVHTFARVVTEGVILELEVSGETTLICDRTAEPFAFEIQTSAKILATDDPDETDEENIELNVADRSIDLTNLVHDLVILAIPAKKLAPGSDEVEIETTFGQSDEIDPRWAPLLKRKSKE